MEFSDLVGKTFVKIDKVLNVFKEIEELHFYSDNGDIYKLYHSQDCCESVYLNDVVGNLDDLLNSTILMAYEASNHDEVTEARQLGDEDFYSETWTFYHLATLKGYVSLRWIGSSSGYYSESVDLIKVE